MIDELKKVLLAGLGSAAYTYEKGSKLIDEMVKKGKLTLEEGKELSQELKKSIKEKSELVGEKVKPVSKQDISDVLDKYTAVLNAEITELKERVSKLEDKIQ
ncbi:polyhydroxyalkanoate synthesis regulator phasin [Clostridium acetobutylicum]|uniref:Polyhydroxyalkanoate synthesis regulator phasin n=1 Tax=Clostridium acetobutylicum (strain ATCC 824 / DSM 792 / JCM 1419 / IAM 19013 / LMG 5710 / NBRC 13948 / NRRL B-527 / VKM B-1787 / 2291 / W) TaxID=272562 RepID=Q97N05_CLOAB|nr:MULTISPECIES: phasin family protein [Clostridium]AAK78021.1 Hypothetical protein CA_C0034 [Clostridium acetobutylicum ATCC 824]ADZ19077.1 Conserved hypothetical protein [Clostridium acetobutylicum EA 2018]AEI31019.1 hypothetical protein SMB_G0034 [Clostridium acetobutylicum DSM 1731]AWV81916.1 hypothetical protein DK921_17890 [Clostridium acetobutylicum]KHD34612.1 hypothetical protein NL50_16425 [Clostridium acetobutylicum]